MENPNWNLHVEMIDQMDDLCAIPATPSRARVLIRRSGYMKRVTAWLEAGGVRDSPEWSKMIEFRDRLARSLAADQPVDMLRFWMRWAD